MEARSHHAYQEENEWLHYTLEYIKKTTISHIHKKENIDNTVRTTLKHFDSANSEDYITLMVNTLLKDRMDILLKNLVKAKSKPYFARVDFLEDRASVPERLYIGKMSLIREEDQEVIIVDWRAPAANLYYEERLGQASYRCPDGLIQGELSLKRQYTIDQGILLDMMDIDITTNDNFLQGCLSSNADNRLKEIVSTIQAEQNQVIRTDMWNPLIVQGAAGSGKTTIALHRIAYLIYTYEKTFRPENYMIIAPNRLFLNYISEVLPELGVEMVKQTTFVDFAQECIGKKYKIQDTHAKLAILTETPVPEAQKAEHQRIWEASKFKSSMHFKHLLDKYILLLEEDYLPEEDFQLGPYTLFSRKAILHMFRHEYYDLPFSKRMDRIGKQLTSKVKSSTEGLCQQLQEECDKNIFRIKTAWEDEEARRPLISKVIDQKNNQIMLIEKQAKQVVKQYLAGVKQPTPTKCYQALFEDDSLFYALAVEWLKPSLIDYIRNSSLTVFKSKFIEVEDLAAIVYLKMRLEGLHFKIATDHVVVDEAQDLSVFQLFVLRKLVKKTSMTILGDLCQGIHDYRGTTNWEEVMEEVFENRCKYLTLKQSYRTTVEIMEAANQVIKPLVGNNIPLAQPVIRYGHPVSIHETSGEKEMAQAIAVELGTCMLQGYKTIAIIGKTLTECKSLHHLLKKTKENIHLITGKDQEYPGGTVIIPVYMAKGLEFDAVIIANASLEAYPDDILHRKLLYVAMTRPLHRMTLYYYGIITPLLSGVSSN